MWWREWNVHTSTEPPSVRHVVDTPRTHAGGEIEGRGGSQFIHLRPITVTVNIEDWNARNHITTELVLVGETPTVHTW
ncbi:hypothetical protein E2C01_012299 [Portunus trituberculatus]|uniref:Uncharacterized protein n=1 Tax=Portunus trituberculatus TaxID=210409 RepID=A0A5B7DE62_PORTR|nr:hypothetical protein [Portunus trituberculatus]